MRRLGGAFGRNSILFLNDTRFLPGFVSYAQLSNLTALNRSQMSSLLGTFRNYTQSGNFLSSASNATENVTYATANVTYSSINLTYGRLRQLGRYVNAGSNLTFAALAGNSLNFMNVTVVKAAPQVSINAGGHLITGAGNYSVPSAVLPFGPHKGQYQVALNYNGSLIRGNTGAFNYSLGFSNGTTVIPETTLQNQSITGSRNLWVNASATTEFRLDFAGNANYTPLDPIISVFPANIIYFVNVTFTNTPSVAVAANTPLMVTFNAVAYQSYETCSLNNIEFFYFNGTVMPSWLEGNRFSEMTANGLCTGVANVNALSTATNAIFWVESPPTNAFLPANTGTATTNTVYLGFASTSGINFFSSVGKTGEAPQLTCAYGTVTQTCAYGQYDNANSIFTLYDNFEAPTGAHTHVSALWTVANSLGVNLLASNAIANNGLSINAINTNSIALKSASTFNGIWFETYVISTTNSGLKSAGVEISSSTFTNNAFQNGYGVTFNTITAVNTMVFNAIGNGFPIGSITTAQPNVIGVAWPNNAALTTNVVFNLGYTYTTSANALATPQTTGNTLSILITTGNSGASVTYTMNTMWARARIYPPNDIMPSVTFFPAPTSAPQKVNPQLVVPSNEFVGSVYNGIVTGICFPGDSCQIWYNGAVQAVNALTNSNVFINENSLPFGTTSVYANDITSNLQSANAVIKNINVQHWLQVELQNRASVPVPANTPLAIGTTTIGNIIGFNALNFNVWEANTLNNTVVYFRNGTVARSWIEGNMINEQTNTNTLIKTGNVLIWFKSPPTNGFLPANTGVTPTNTVFLGFDIITNTLVDGNYIGVAPQLTCSNPAVPQLCAAGGGQSGTYGAYDNGPSIFTLYDNFKGIGATPSSLWSPISFSSGATAPGNNAIASNGLSLNAMGVNSIALKTASTYSGVFFEAYVSSTTSGSVKETGVEISNTVTFDADNGFDFGYGVAFNGITSVNTIVFNALGLGFNYGSAITTVQPNVIGVAWPNSITLSANQVNNVGYTFTAASNVLVQPGKVGNTLSLFITTGKPVGAAAITMNVMWARARIYPPNGIEPTAIVYQVPNAFISGPSNAIVDVNQYESFTVNVINGTSPYTYNFLVVNSVTVGTIAHNALYKNGLTSNTFTFQVIAADTANSQEEANVILTDANIIATTVNSIYSTKFTIDPALVAGNIAPSAPKIDSDQVPIMLSSAASGGTTAYSYVWYSNTIGNPSCNPANTILGASNTLSTISVSPTTTNTYAYQVMDTASFPDPTCSSPDTVTVNSKLAVPSIAPASKVYLDAVNTITFSTSGVTGTPNYQYKWVVYNTFTPGTALNTTIYTGCTIGSNTFVFTANANLIGNTINANVIVTDSSTAGAETANSVLSNTIVINGPLVVGNIAPASVFLDSGQQVTLTSTPSGGTTPYSYAWYTSNAGNPICNAANTILGASNTLSTISVSPTTTNSYTYLLTDSATFNSFGCSLQNYATTSITNGINNPSGVAMAPSGNYAYVTNYNAANAVIVSTATNSVVNSITSVGAVQSAAFSPTAGYAYLVSGGIIIVNTSTNSVIGTYNNGFQFPYGAAIAPNGQYAIVTNQGSNNVVIFNTATNSVVQSITNGISFGQGVAIAPNGQYAYISNGGSSNVVIFSTVTNSVVGVLPGGINNPWGISFAPSGAYAYVVNHGSGNVVVVNTATNTVVNSLPGGYNNPQGVAIAPNGAYAYITNTAPGNGNVVIVNTGISTIAVNPALGIPSIAPSSAQNAYTNQVLTFSTTITGGGGTPPYTYNWLVVNSMNGQVLGNAYYTTTSTSNSFGWLIPSADANNAVLANVMVTDSASTPKSTNSIKSGLITIYSFPAITSWTASKSAIDIGQTQVLTAAWSGGVPTFTANFLVYNGVNGLGTLVYNALYPGLSSSASPNTFTFIQGSTPGTYTANIIIQDSLNNNAISTLTYMVGTALGVPTISPSNTLLDTSQTEAYTIGGITGTGVGPYTVNIMNVTGNKLQYSFGYQQWLPTNSYPFNTSSTVCQFYSPNNNIYCVGGYDGSNYYNTDYYSAVSSNGQIGQWISTNTYPIAALSADCVLNGNQIYCIGGNTASGPTANAYYTTILPSGALATWSPTNNLLAPTYLTQCVNSQGYIYCIDGFINGNLASNAVYAANILSVGGVGTWNFVGATSANVEQPDCRSYHNNAYCFGGQQISGGTVTNSNSVTFAPLLSGGSIGSWATSVNSIPLAPGYLSQYTCGITQSYVYCGAAVSNTFVPTFTSNTYYAPIFASNDVGSWTQSTSYPLAVDAQSCPIDNSTPIPTMYCVGGAGLQGFVAHKSNAVYYAPLSQAGFANSLQYNFITYSSTQNNPFTYNVIVTDQATTQNSISNTITVSQALGPPSISPTTNEEIDAVNTITFSTSFSGGSKNYQYKWVVYNTFNLNAPLNTTIYTGCTLTSNAFIFTANTNIVGNTIAANVLVTDSAGAPESQNSVLSGTMTINNALIAGNIQPSSPGIDSGEQITLSSEAYGGSSPYQYVWYTNTAGNPSCNPANTILGASNTLSTISVGPTAPSNTYTYQVTDSATPNTVLCSSPDTVTVNSALGHPSIFPALTQTFDAGQTITFSTSIGVTGTPNYQYKWVVYNTFTPGTPLNTTIYTGCTIGSNTFVFTANANLAGNTINANVIVTDSSAAGAETTNSVKSGTQTINKALTSTSWTATNMLVDANQYETLTATVAGGTEGTGYTFNFLVYNTLGTLVANALYNGVPFVTNAFTFQTSAAWLGSATSNALISNIIVTDHATTPTNAVNSLSIGENAMLTSTSWTASNKLIDTGQTQVLTAAWSGGTSKFTANFLVYNTVGLVSNALYTGVVASPNTFTFMQNAAWGIGTFTANEVLNDSATTNGQIKSTLTYTVNSPLSSTVLWTNSNAMVQTNQYQLLTATVSQGTPPYTYNFLVYSPSSVLTYNALYISALTTDSFFYQQVDSNAGTWMANIIVNDSATSNEMATNTLNYQEANGCTILLGSNSVGFGSLGANQKTFTNFGITDTDSGTAPANIIVAGNTLWLTSVSGAYNSFYIQNTLWDITSDSSYAGNQLTNSLMNTFIEIPAGSQNSIYFGLGIPPGTLAADAGTPYSSTIIIENSC